MRPRIRFHRAHMFHRGVLFVRLRDRREIRFRDVAREERRLGSQEEELARDGLLIFRSARR